MARDPFDQAHDEAKGLSGLDLAIFGQERDNATYALAHMNAIPDRDVDALDRFWQVFPGVRATLFRKADRHLPTWRMCRQELNSAPLAKEAWSH